MLVKLDTQKHRVWGSSGAQLRLQKSAHSQQLFLGDPRRFSCPWISRAALAQQARLSCPPHWLAVIRSHRVAYRRPSSMGGAVVHRALALLGKLPVGIVISRLIAAIFCQCAGPGRTPARLALFDGISPDASLRGQLPARAGLPWPRDPQGAPPLQACL